MSNLDDVPSDIELARKMMSESDKSLVVVQYNKVWKKSKETGVKPFLEAIVDLKEELNGTVIGIDFLDKAAAMLCRYAKVSGVYAPRATKEGIALLIMAGIHSEIDEMIPNVENKEDLLLKDVNSAEEAYKILKEAVR